MLKPISTWFLAFETALLQLNSNLYQNAPKNKFPCINNEKFTQNALTIIAIFICLTTKLEIDRFSDKLNQFPSGPIENVNKSLEVTYEILTQNRKTFHTHQNPSIPFHPKKTFAFSSYSILKRTNF